MTVIAWDGKSIAADKRATSSDMQITTTKLRRIKRGDHIPEVMAYTGQQDTGEALMAWYAAGADPAYWPECQKDDGAWSRLIVADADGVSTFERQPFAVRVEDPFMAWGSGRDFAMAAMHLGKSAIEAVQIASLFEISCGNGVDSFEL